MIGFETTAIATAAAGLATVAVLVGRLRAADAELRLKRHRSKDAALVDLLNYAAEVDDGIVVGKDGSFTASWLYRCPDMASASDDERNVQSMHLARALAPLGNGWMVSQDAVRREAPGYTAPAESHFPDPVSRAIDEERRRHFTKLGTLFEGYFVISLTWLPPMLAQARFAELMFDDDAVRPDHTTRTYLLIEQYKQHIASIENSLSTVLNMTRLRGQKLQDEFDQDYTQDDLLSWLQFCITGIHQPIRLPKNPAYLDAVIGCQDFVPGTTPRIGRKYIQCVAIDGLPLESSPGILQALAELPVEYRWNNRFICLDRHQALALMEDFRKKWKQKFRSIFDQMFNTHLGGINQDAVMMEADASAAKAELESGLVSGGFYTSVVVLRHENRDTLDTAANQIKKVIEALGFNARIEEVNNMDAFFGTLPSHAVQNLRRPLIHTANLADFIPMSSSWTGSERTTSTLYPKGSPRLMQCVTHGRTPFHFNLHVQDLGHSFIFGPTRKGKSTLLGLIAAQLLRYKGMRIFLFEAGMSAYPLTKALRGQHYVVGGDADRLQFAPLQHLDKRSDLAWAMRWIDRILLLNGVDTTPKQRNAIGETLVGMRDTGSRTMSEFFNGLQDEVLREALQQYTVDGAMGHLLDAETDGLNFSRFNTFEMGELMEMGEKYAVPALLYIFRRIERSLDGKPTVIFLDEAWLMLSHPVFKEWIRKWLKTLAKLNCAVIPATQNVSDASKSGIFDVILESTATKILLPNPEARDPEATELYRRMGLNDRQIDNLANAVGKQDYYFMSNEGHRRMFSLDLGPLALSFVGATDKESIATIQRLEVQHGEQWVHHWLASRNLKLDDYLEAA
ncbi:VirB4 family type IV secretion/conjugal transfer ATPase [Azohydromonas caseinilytica]|uniref:Conjugal transfer protein TrbE n=1 Tax=Azohydromonas caseinilytica TaxID=2728836 RepID=A0A848FCF1_9BURK|nr:conjugal transfer protein TrbE [Azohydromonas caseinilytica]NML17008.1 conjugal transfer protein TrbE [Azohydromonas caseinilytica]